MLCLCYWWCKSHSLENEKFISEESIITPKHWKIPYLIVLLSSISWWNEHLQWTLEGWRSRYWTKYNLFHFCMLKCIIVYKIQNRNTSNLRGTPTIRVNCSASFCISTYELGKSWWIYSFFHDLTFIFLTRKSCPRLARYISSSRHQSVIIITIRHRFYGAL